MIPILMTVFAIGGTTFGMAEESLAFYVLIITVMIAAGYDALTGALVILLGCGHRGAGLDRQPVRHRHRLRLRRRLAQRRSRAPTRHPGRRPRRGDLVRAPLRRAGAARPVHVARVRHEGRPTSGTSPRRPTPTTGEVVLTGQHKLILGLFGAAFAVMVYGVIPWEDLGIGLPDAVVVVPGDDGVVPAVRHPHRPRRQDEGGRAHHDVRRRCSRPARRRPDHRHRPRHHRRS